MREFFRIVEPPRTCSYLPDEAASLEVRGFAQLAPGEYGGLLERGYRRFGAQLFRPACPVCSKCRSLRVLVREFSPSASQRRILRKNEGVRAELHPLFASPEHIELHNRYHAFMHGQRGWPVREIDRREYHQGFLAGGAALGRQWLYFDRDRLIGVALMDEAPGAISLVYCFYDPDWREASPGTFSILTQLAWAKKAGLDYAYLGYWIEACQSMSYKNRFRPFEILASYPPDSAAAVWKLAS